MKHLPQMSILLAFAVGVWSLAAQFIFNRIIYFYIANSEYVAASIISIHLLGFLIGTLFVRKVCIAPATLVFASALTVVGANLIVWRLGAPIFGLPLTVLFAVMFGLVLAGLSGALILRLMDNQRSDGRGIIISDSAGSVAGAVLGGFILVPKLGLTLSFGTVLVAQAAVLIMLLWPLHKQGSRLALLLAPAIGIFVTFTTPPHPGAQYIRAAEGMVLTRQSESNRMLQSLHTPYGIVSAMEDGDELATLLRVDNRGLCYVPHKTYAENSEYLIGVFPPKMLVPNGRQKLRIANIGLGCGMTLSALLENSPADTAIDLIEINPDMPEAQKNFWAVLPANYTDARVTTHIADGFGFFADRKNQPPYDAVVIDLAWMSNMNASHLFTIEMYQSVARNLAPDGVLAVWTEESNPMGPIARTLYQTLKQVFPNVQMQYAGGIVILYASSTREDLSNFLTSQDALYSGWLDDAESRDPSPVNRLDDLILNRHKFTAFGDNISDRLFGQYKGEVPMENR